MCRENKLNDLSARRWLRETKSFWVAGEVENSPWTEQRRAELSQWLQQSYGEDQAEQMLDQILPSAFYSVAPPRDKLKLRHPATFSEHDIERLIRLFTKQGQCVLDPFVGSGSTLIACHQSNRRGIGIELVDEWVQISRQRLQDAGAGDDQRILHGDAEEKLDEIDEGSVDFIVTSPPYWNILAKKPGMKAQAERVKRDLPTDYGDHDRDLGSIADYACFLERLGALFGKCARTLKPGGYLACIVSDFRHGPRFYMYHADLATMIERHGLPPKGITVLLQNNKNLYPFAIPYAFVSNIHHQYILIHQKPKSK